MARIPSALLALTAMAAPVPLAAGDCAQDFRIVGWPGGDLPGRALQLEDFKGGALVVSGADVAGVKARRLQNGAPAVGYSLTQDGASAFGHYTTDHMGEPVAIIFRDKLIVAPMVQVPVWGGTGIISGLESLEQAIEIVETLEDPACGPGDRP